MGRFGLVPYWEKLAKALISSRRFYNARSETIPFKPSLRGSFSRAQFCIIPATAIYEPRYHSRRTVRWRIERVDRELIGVAGVHVQAVRLEQAPVGGHDASRSEPHQVARHKARDGERHGLAVAQRRRIQAQQRA